MFGIFHSLFLPSDQHDQHQSRPRRGVIFPSLRLARLGKGRPSELVVQVLVCDESMAATFDTGC